MMLTYVVGCLFILYAFGVLRLVWNLFRTRQLIGSQAVLSTPGIGGENRPSLDIVIPVKDEEDHIGLCLESVLAQDYPNKRVIVVNDRSTDGTVAAVEAIQRRHPELRRIDITELPDGQFGKPSALHAAAPELRGELVAFVDSDFQLRPRCLTAVVDHLLAQKNDWVAVMGQPELTMFWERLLIPLLGAVTYAWFDPRKIADPKWDDAIGSGFILVRRAAYQAIGGHGAVVRAYDEDSAIMRIAKRAGHRIAYLLAPELFTLRMYGGLGRTVKGITRTFIGGLRTVPRFLMTMNGLNFVSLMPIGNLVTFGLAAVWQVPIPWLGLWLGVSALHLLVSTALAWTVYAQAGIPGRFALLHPLGAVVLSGICTRAMKQMRRGEGITWRGTSY
jgi:chlorobactene glucosyltransferase